MPNDIIFDIFAAQHVESRDAYMQLLLDHARDCGGPEKKDDQKTRRINQNLMRAGGVGHYRLMKQLGVAAVSNSVVEMLPAGAVFLRFKFTLDRRYLSRDDCAFFPTDNPIKREHVFKVPMVTAATWKGNFRAAFVQRLLMESEIDVQAEARLTMFNLLGDEKAHDSNAPDAPRRLREFLDGELDSLATELYYGALPTNPKGSGPQEYPRHRGRLIFFPSWFEQSSLDVLNPRDRKTRAGTQPISLECVPAGKESTFTLLYLPFDLLGRQDQIASAQRDDWKVIGATIFHMLCKSGFGAKKSSGYGVIRTSSVKDVEFLCLSNAFCAPAITSADELVDLHKAFSGVNA